MNLTGQKTEVSVHQLEVLNTFLQKMKRVKGRKKYLKSLDRYHNLLKDESRYFIDKRDYNIYRVVEINGRKWLGENFRYRSKKSVKNPKNPSILYGRFYSWKEAISNCPKGWHLSTDEDWKSLEIALGMRKKTAEKEGGRGSNQGYKLKSSEGWEINPACKDSGNGLNAFGMNVLPAGGRAFDFFMGLGENTSFFCSTHYHSPFSGFAWSRILDFNSKKIYRIQCPKISLGSIRYVKD